MAQAAIDEEFQRIAVEVAQRSGALDELTVRRWMKSVEALQAQDVVSDADAFHLLSTGYAWLNNIEKALHYERLALQRLPVDSPNRPEALIGFAVLSYTVGEKTKAVDSLIEAMRSPHVHKVHCAGVLVGALCALDLVEEAASVADEYLTDDAIEAEPPSINPALAFADLGRRHDAVEQLARYVLRTHGTERGARTALEVLEHHREQLLLTLSRKPSLLDAWRYVEAFDKAQRARGDAGAAEGDGPPSGEIPEWVRVLRGRAAREVLSERDS